MEMKKQLWPESAVGTQSPYGPSSQHPTFQTPWWRDLDLSPRRVPGGLRSFAWCQHRPSLGLLPQTGWCPCTCVPQVARGKPRSWGKKRIQCAQHFLFGPLATNTKNVHNMQHVASFLVQYRLNWENSIKIRQKKDHFLGEFKLK